ncbi:hypothetical protein PIB30_052330 [Stylosanthes scabra]|uniref:Putative plant transposon protein domain-containing protein n=1 Tax=Stylosanthes scabra TaxID=79078 RepID=A0ABU6XID5_9FABA|nr:hypothetical protein [Stylosanthes scabra]
MIYRRLGSQQEESRKSFEALNTRMDRFDDQLSYLCYSTQMTNEQMLSPYQDTTRLMREMEMQGIPVTMANLAIHRQKEEEMRQERMRYDQILQEVAEEKAREANKGKAREIVEDSEEVMWKLSARKVLPKVPIDLNDDILSPCAIQIRMRKWEKFTAPLQAVGHNLVKECYANAWEPDKAKRKPYIYTTMVQGTDISFAPRDMKRVLKLKSNPFPNAPSYHERKANKDYRLEEVSILPTTNRSELTVERAVLIHSIIIGENINVEEIIAEQFYKFIYKTDLSSSLHFPSIIAALCLDAKVTTLKDDTLINQELPIAGEALIRTREGRARNPRQEAPPP